MAPQKTTGIILQVRDYSETSKLVNILTSNCGLLKTLAKGAHRLKSPHRGKLELLNYGSLIYYPSRSSDLHILSQFDIINSFPGALSTVEKSAFFHYLAELSSLAAYGEEAGWDLFNLLYQILEDAPKIDEIIPARLWFEIRYLHLLGILPSLDRCAGCGRSLSNVLSGNLKFSLQKPGFLCSVCDSSSAEFVDIEPGVIAVIRYVLRNSLDQVMKLKLSRRQSELLRRLLSYLVDSAAHKKIKSKRFLNHVLSEAD